MKTKSIYVAAVALALMATGCSDDQLVQVQGPASEGHQVRVTASMGAESRLAITDTGKRLEFTWQDDDVFHVFDPANHQTTVFEKEPDASQEPSPYGTFVGTPQVAYTEGSKLYAVYHTQNDTLQFDANGNVTLDISQQNGQLDERFQYMFAEATYTDTEESAFPFRHLVTMIKLNIRVPEHVTHLKEVHFNYSGLPTQATLVLTQAPYDSFGLFKPGDLVVCYDNYQGTADFKVEGEFVPVDGVVTVYLYVLPVKRYYANNDWYEEPSLQPSVWMLDAEDKQYVGTATFDGKQIEAGKTYQLNTDVIAMEPFANEATATGLADSPYEIATAGQLYTFMLRTSKEMANPNNRNYTNCHYKLTADIQLDNEMLWVPTYLYSATFDGNGKTISGNISMHVEYQTGLFNYISNATIQDLTLDLNTTFDNTYNQEWFGMLTAETYNSQIINCVNRSNVTGYFWRMAGLVGYARYNTQITACGNTGTFTSLNENRQMGGLVAETQGSNIKIEGCYNTGHFNVHSMYWEGLEVGGIVGRASYGNVNIQNCWSHDTLSIENVTYDDHIMDAPHNIFFGAIVGYQNVGSISNCYWNECVEFATGYENGTVTEVGTFAGAAPDAAQIATMNHSLSNKGWMFKEDGTLKANDYTSLPSWGKENFGNN